MITTGYWLSSKCRWFWWKHDEGQKKRRKKKKNQPTDAKPLPIVLICKTTWRCSRCHLSLFLCIFASKIHNLCDGWHPLADMGMTSSTSTISTSTTRCFRYNKPHISQPHLHRFAGFWKQISLETHTYTHLHTHTYIKWERFVDTLEVSGSKIIAIQTEGKVSISVLKTA